MSDDAWTANEALSNLRNALVEKGMSIDDMFSKIDADSDGTINGPELHHGIRDILGDVLSPGQISEIIKALDGNEDHRIDVAELREALQEEE